jgi:Flp pilus assembly secretin CpaC
MTAFDACRGQRPLLFPGLRCAVVALTFALAVALLPGAARAADVVSVGSVHDVVTVHVDQAQLLKLPERTATLVVGNPLIADAVVQPGGTVVITAKSYGRTNLVALDRTGTMLGEYPIQVVGPADSVVLVYRGIERETYSCAPNCERRITIGDSQLYLTGNLMTLGAFNAQAQGDQKK